MFHMYWAFLLYVTSLQRYNSITTSMEYTGTAIWDILGYQVLPSGLDSVPASDRHQVNQQEDKSKDRARSRCILESCVSFLHANDLICFMQGAVNVHGFTRSQDAKHRRCHFSANPDAAQYLVAVPWAGLDLRHI